MVQQAGFAGIRPAGDHHGHAVAQQATLAGGGLQLAQALPQIPQAPGDDPVGEEIDLFLGEVDRRFDIDTQLDQTLDQTSYLPGELALQGTQGGASGGSGVTGDQIGNRLGLSQVEFIVEKGAFGKFAGSSWPRTEFHHSRQQQIHDHRPAVPLKFQHVLAGKGMWRGKIKDKTFVEHRAIARAEPAKTSLPRRGHDAAHGHGDGGNRWTGHANHANAAPTRRGGDGGDGGGHTPSPSRRAETRLPPSLPGRVGVGNGL